MELPKMNPPGEDVVTKERLPSSLLLNWIVVEVADTGPLAK